MTPPRKRRWHAVLRFDDQVIGMAPLGTHKTAPRPKQITFMPTPPAADIYVLHLNQASLLRVVIEPYETPFKCALEETDRPRCAQQCSHCEAIGRQ